MSTGFWYEGKKRPQRRSRYMWEEKQVGVLWAGWGVMGWIHLPQGRNKWGAFVKTAMNFQVP
jgi:hypothetical protein